MATRKHSLGIPVVAVLAATVAIVAIGWTGPANSSAAARQAANKAATVQTKTLKKLGTILVTSAQALFPENALGQSNAFWNTYYNTWMFVYGTGFG